jgi:hypothetical protein
VLRIVTPCGIVGRYLDRDDGGSMLLRTAGMSSTPHSVTEVSVMSIANEGAEPTAGGGVRNREEGWYQNPKV